MTTTTTTRYEIRWYGHPESTARAAGRAPRGGDRGYATRAAAERALAAYLRRCGSLGGTVEAACSPRVTSRTEGR